MFQPFTAPHAPYSTSSPSFLLNTSNLIIPQVTTLCHTSLRVSGNPAHFDNPVSILRCPSAVTVHQWSKYVSSHPSHYYSSSSKLCCTSAVPIYSPSAVTARQRLKYASGQSMPAVTLLVITNLCHTLLYVSGHLPCSYNLLPYFAVALTSVSASELCYNFAATPMRPVHPPRRPIGPTDLDPVPIASPYIPSCSPRRFFPHPPPCVHHPDQLPTVHNPGFVHLDFITSTPRIPTRDSATPCHALPTLPDISCFHHHPFSALP